MFKFFQKLTSLKALKSEHQFFRGDFKFFYFLIQFVIGSVSIQAQTGSYFECLTGPKPVFEGEAEQTLCEQYPNFICDIQIGIGTPITKTSQIPLGFLSGNVCIIGDFEVNSSFTFQNATVKINSGVTIRVAGSTNVFDGGSILYINNSRLFACNGLWKGIRLGLLSIISTENFTQIEDAESAIFANTYCNLFIEQTTFNRNKIGIELESANPNIFFNSVPNVMSFRNNFFTCTAPLNGTTNEITQAGIQLTNVPFFAFQEGNNRFRALTYGIMQLGHFHTLEQEA